MIAKYRKKPVVVSAAQFDGTNVTELLDWISADGRWEPFIREGGIFIPTLEGDMRADLGDFIIQGVRGEFYPCKPEVFEATYERVT